MKFNPTKLIVFLFAIVLLVAVIFYARTMMAAQSERPMPMQPDKVANPEVSVIIAETGSYTAEIEAFGAAQAHFDITLTAQVAGQVEQINTQFENGQRLNQGDWLAQLENSDYQAAVNSAKQALAEAKVTLLEEERQGLQALTEWQSSGLEGQPDSDLVLRKPQLEAAKQSVEQAQANLKSAEQDLAQSLLKVPFDALVVNRKIAPGSYVQTGTEVAELYSTDRVEVAVSLAATDWQKLPSHDMLNTTKWPATLISVEHDQQWQGYVLRSEQHLDGETRQRALVLAVDKPFDQENRLYPGTFVKAEIQGLTVDGLWKLPSSALSQRGEIWYVTDDNTLDKFTATTAFTKASDIYIKPPAEFNNTSKAVLAHPLNSYLKGMAVNQVENNDYE
ncbi:efflux RND transporter periplasmic adaptor subunit [Methylophaga thiooxydans]|uniref:efflux RND transporter periplasmic adaptor subunit n=1 Tax=Methylophaga thiooxydans TaxID=392484 RepID=UPI002355C5B7|nr:efflux RND transporter periplasmic adaptor subunit [Methylophaga thiooxydans]